MDETRLLPKTSPERRTHGTKRRNIGQTLVGLGVITDEQLTQALDVQKRTGEMLGQILVEMKVISETQRAMALADQWGYRFVTLRDTPVDPSAARLIPQSLALRLHALPIGWSGERLLLALTDPLNVIAVDDVRLTTGHEVEPVIATEDDLREAIRRIYDVDLAGAAALAAEPSEDETPVERLQALVDEAPVVKMVNTIIDDAIRQGASDIHVDQHGTGILVRYRIDGVLHDVVRAGVDMRTAVVSRIKILAEMDIAERRRPQDGRFRVESPAGAVDLRVSTLPTLFGEKIVMRILDQSSPLISLNHLGFHSQTLREWEAAAHRPHGMILVTGPTGSGKTTTLYATLGTIDTVEKNVVTVEDPAEYQLPRINQVQVNRKAGLTFAGGLRSILRQDPDIIMVGEIRDRETAEIAVQAALTGHLVLSTLHTNDAASAVTRLVDMGIEPFLISSSVIGVLAQRLARQICATCRVSYQAPPEALGRLTSSEDPLAAGPVTLWRGPGCDACRFTGYRGRLALFEFLVITERIRELIVRRASAAEIKAQAVRGGMRTMRDDGLEKLFSGLVTVDEVLRVVDLAEEGEA